MNTNTAATHPTEVFHRSLDFDLMLQGADDSDWLEFLALAEPVAQPDTGDGARWQHTPVLLSY